MHPHCPFPCTGTLNFSLKSAENIRHAAIPCHQVQHRCAPKHACNMRTRPHAARCNAMPNSSIQIANKALDRAADGPLATWALLEPLLKPHSARGRVCTTLMTVPLIGAVMRRAVLTAASRRLTVASTFVRAHLAAKKLAGKYMGEVSSSAGGVEVAEDLETRHAADQVVQECTGAAEAAAAYAKEHLLAADPHLAALLQSRLAALCVLEEQDAFLCRLEGAGGCL